ncbi:hypothetical protein SmJEL517_g05692 [Synchytrium microbalum]|uniref:Uncharacterized protein n=1 Tax=Synchytrium microbalum TaxID=1806994 RepID=A0A507BU43_9FUNG|nr:uncharacterized protein SmJEL517_g05692 [Synchytrium microbalum]TPX30828.1 hypothetical protein SmJEL517_g05692 [Synchytrium microbalum]
MESTLHLVLRLCGGHRGKRKEYMLNNKQPIKVYYWCCVMVFLSLRSEYENAAYHAKLPFQRFLAISSNTRISQLQISKTSTIFLVKLYRFITKVTVCV